ncbi:MAG: secondary thiamine-phosphate synthase enzyme YjbQ [Bacillota bacterium]
MEEFRELVIKTSRQEEMIELTSFVNRIVEESEVENGTCWVYVPHTTCGLTVNEHADPDVASDILRVLSELIPANGGYRHFEGNSPAHIKCTLTGVSNTFLVAGGRLLLGPWQGVFLCEFDGPRQRKVWVKVTESYNLEGKL